jgi:small subunit ribosomal protein S18
MSKKKKIAPRRLLKKKPCRLCRDKVEAVDYRETGVLEKFISDRGKIISSRLTGSCSRHQRMISSAIKRARLAALLPFVRVKEASPHARRGRGDYKGDSR